MDVDVDYQSESYVEPMRDKLLEVLRKLADAHIEIAKLHELAVPREQVGGHHVVDGSATVSAILRQAVWPRTRFLHV